MKSRDDFVHKAIIIFLNDNLYDTFSFDTFKNNLNFTK